MSPSLWLLPLPSSPPSPGARMLAVLLNSLRLPLESVTWLLLAPPGPPLPSCRDSPLPVLLAVGRIQALLCRPPHSPGPGVSFLGHQDFTGPSEDCEPSPELCSLDAMSLPDSGLRPSCTRLPSRMCSLSASSPQAWCRPRPTIPSQPVLNLGPDCYTQISAPPTSLYPSYWLPFLLTLHPLQTPHEVPLHSLMKSTCAALQTRRGPSQPLLQLSATPPPGERRPLVQALCQPPVCSSPSLPPSLLPVDQHHTSHLSQTASRSPFFSENFPKQG